MFVVNLVVADSTKEKKGLLTLMGSVEHLFVCNRFSCSFIKGGQGLVL